MIDLNRPIRHKYSKQEVRAWLGMSGSIVIQESVGLATIVSDPIFQGLYENVPAKREPQEWYLDLFSTKFYASKEFIQPNARRRVIEWPEGALIPTWPEGY